MTFFTASIFKTQIANFHFFFSMQAFTLTVGCLLVIFLVTLAFNLLVVGRTSIIDLMSAGRKNEAIKTRNPMLSAVVFVLGAVLIGVAYYRLLRDGLPVDAPANEMDAAMAQFLPYHGYRGGGNDPVLLWPLGFSAQGAAEREGLVLARTQHVHAASALCQGEHGQLLYGHDLDDSVPRDHERHGRHVYRERDEHERGTQQPRGLLAHRDLLRREDAGEQLRLRSPMGIAEEPFDIVELSKGDRVNPGLANEEAFDLDSILGKRVQVEGYDSTPRGGSEPVVTLNQLCEAVDMPLPVGTGSANSNVMGLQVMKESDYNRYRAFRGLARSIWARMGTCSRPTWARR